MPFEHADYSSAAGERVRQAVITWIRTTGAADGFVNFDRAVRDPSHPAQLASEYDCGNHLHPNDRGHRTMGKALPLEWFR